MQLLDIKLIDGELERLIEQGRGGTSCSAFALPFAARCYMAARLGKPVLYLCSDYLQARKSYALLNQLCQNAVFLPPKDDVLYLQTAASPERMEALMRITSGNASIVVTPIETLLQRAPDPEEFRRSIITLSKGSSYNIDELCLQLVNNGYRRTAAPESACEFSLRGDIMDIISATGRACRCEFFGDELEVVRELDVSSRLSQKHLQSFVVTPSDEPTGTASLMRCLDPRTVIIWDEAKTAADTANYTLTEHQNRFKTLFAEGKVRREDFDALFSLNDLLRDIAPFVKIACHTILSQNRFFQPQALFNFTSSSVPKYSHSPEMLASDARMWSADGYRVYLCARDENAAGRICDALFDAGVLYSRALGNVAGVYVLPVLLDNGFIVHEEKLAVIGTHELMSRSAAGKTVHKAAEVFTVSDIGDYVVHSKHGVGRIAGIERLGGVFGASDFIIVEYAGGDKLYVPTVEAHRLSRFAGVDGEVRLNRIGGADFAKVKSRAAKSVKQMAFSLVKLYAEREANRVDPLIYDEKLFGEFCSRFAHSETDDQLRAVADVLKDLDSGRVMDRLLCGDVGYGKTEVALRAAFAIILSGKQVAFLAPTTILTEQHYRTACERMSEFGVSVGVLSRFHSEQQNKKVIERLGKGEIDIVFGTHRLLSKDVTIKNLGLMVLDEEQRFGVEDKERIKEFKKNIHVLTLSATPIPRTLHMSMSQIRDMSVLDTPPSERLPVRTFVTEFSHGLLRDAIGRELSRGGQVFVVYNRVSDIDRFAAEIKEIVPEARIAVGHGQMQEDKLDKIISDFYEGSTDVLVASTIIENGIDVANANTLIIADSDRLGLAQMYQLRGRVGRSNRLAYAYFTVPENKLLTAEAEKRLAAIAEFTEFGSGFKLAMRDLEIRGAGTVLGREQHGHIEKVGYDMYLKLLSDAVSELQGNVAKEAVETKIDMRMEAVIPDYYVEDSNDRMHAYQKIAGITSENVRRRVVSELTDIYGRPPAAVINLTHASLLRYYGEQLGASKIEVSNDDAKIYFATLSDITESVNRALERYEDCCILKMQNTPLIAFDSRYKKNVLQTLIDFLTTATTK